MDSFEWNKIAGAVLFALLLSVGVKVLSETFFESEPPETPGYVIAVATEAGDQAPAAPQPIGVLLASADPKAGEATAKRCAACHTFAQGDPNKVGPNLWDIVNRPIASHEGFEYDDAMHAFAQEAKTWTFEHLNTFLTNPSGTVPGTKMAFPGLKNDQERANVIAYLRTLSANPAPLPDAASAGGETSVASAAPAGGTAEAPAAAAPAAPEAAAPATGTAEAPAVAPAAPAEPAAAPAEQAPAQPQAAQAEAPAAATPAAPAEAPATAAAAAAAGDATKGATYAKRCTVCHSLAKDGPNQVGPHIYGVVGRPIASVADYNYSDAMKAFSANGTKVWDEATLDSYLTNPRQVVPGTKMVFPGINSEADRANVIAYLKTLTE